MVEFVSTSNRCTLASACCVSQAWESEPAWRALQRGAASDDVASVAFAPEPRASRPSSRHPRESFILMGIAEVPVAREPQTRE